MPSHGYESLPSSEKESLYTKRPRRDQRARGVWSRVLQVVGGLVVLYGLFRYVAGNSEMTAWPAEVVKRVPVVDTQVLRHHRRRLSLQPQDEPFLGPVLAVVLGTV